MDGNGNRPKSRYGKSAYAQRHDCDSPKTDYDDRSTIQLTVT